MAQKPTVSVVIPSLNRKEVLTNTVTELLKASSDHMEEVIVVDQSDAENEFLSTLGDSRLIYNRAKFQNLPQARNVGWALARGDIVLFLDDDVADLATIVDAHARAHLRTKADVVTGPIVRPREKLISLSSLSSADRQELPFGRKQIMNLDAEYIPIFAPGGNSSYLRSLLKKLGGFDENFIGSAVGEDSEMSHRAISMGARIIYDPTAMVVHLDAQSGGCVNETDWTRRAEAKILNSHYFHHKIGAKSLVVRGLCQIIYYEVLNPESLRSNSIGTIARRLAKLTWVCWKARSRTTALLQRSVR